jgi:hypothetical protein
MKIPPNNLCPCRSGKKFKKCCRGKVDWERILSNPRFDPAEYLSLRGKNIFFLERIADALQLDRISAPPDLSRFKRAFTAKAVVSIAEAIIMTWPSSRDLHRALAEERPFNSGLYTGTYSPEAIQRGVTRHSLYCDSLLLADPLMDPRHVRAKFSPLEHPDLHRSSTLRWVTLWFSLAPWIESGVVKFVRSPGDFDAALDMNLMLQARQRVESEADLATLQKAFVDEHAESMTDSYKRQMQLGIPDSYIRSSLRDRHPEQTEAQIEAVIRHLDKMRAADPYFIHTVDEAAAGELLHLTTGMNYDMAKYTAIVAGAHLVTDLDVRWKELELDKQRGGFDPKRWSPFSKAFQGLPWRFLDNVPLEAAHRLRNQGRLEDMRSFLRKSWRAAAPETPFDEGAASNLAAELNERMRDAEVEWSQIDRDLMKWAGSELAVGLLGAAPAISLGAVSWAAGGMVAAGITNLAITHRRRAEWETKFPAGFLVKLRKESQSRRDAT